MMRIFVVCILLGISAKGQVSIKLHYNSALEQGRWFRFPLKSGADRVSFTDSMRINITPDTTGFITLNFKLDSPTFLYFFEKKPHQVYLEPGASITINVNDTLDFQGDLVIENRFLEKLIRTRKGTPLSSDTAALAKRLVRFRTADDFVDSLQSELDREIRAVNDLDKNKVSPRFRGHFITDAALYYRLIGLTALEIRYKEYMEAGSYYEPVPPTNQKYLKETEKIWQYLYPDSLLSQGQYSKWYLGYLWSYLKIYKYDFLKIRNDPDPDFFWLRRQLALGKAFLPPNALETFSASHLSMLGPLDYLEHPAVVRESYDVFKTFPNSVYADDLDHHVLKMKKAVELINTLQKSEKPKRLPIDFSVENPTLEALDDLPRVFSEKVTMIILWTSSCTRCIDSIRQYNAFWKLKTIRRDFEMLFISLDEPKDERKWKQLVKNEKFFGYHLLASETLRQQLRKKHERSLPLFWLTRPNEKLSERVLSAPYPSQSRLRLLNNIITSLKMY